MDAIRVGILGLGENTRARHLPGLQACAGVEIVSVCNRTAESTRRAAQEFSIPKTFDHWEPLVRDSDIDAVVIGTWPYLHAPITLTALDAGKHVLTEARMAMDLREAQQMLDASRRHPDRVAQIVPSPFGLLGDDLVRERLTQGALGELREVIVLATADTWMDEHAPLHWRQDRALNGINLLALGILHETLSRWLPDPVRVFAQGGTFVPQRRDPRTAALRTVDRPDSVFVCTELPNGGRGLYHLSGGIAHGPAPQIRLHGSRGTMIYEFAPRERLLGGDRHGSLQEIALPHDRGDGWRVEAEFVGAIRGHESVRYTTFHDGVRYMRFTQAVADSLVSRQPVEITDGSRVPPA